MEDIRANSQEVERDNFSGEIENGAVDQKPSEGVQEESDSECKSDTGTQEHARRIVLIKEVDSSLVRGFAENARLIGTFT